MAKTPPPHPDREELHPRPELLVKQSPTVSAQWLGGAQEWVTALQPSCRGTAPLAVHPVSFGFFCAVNVD